MTLHDDHPMYDPLDEVLCLLSPFPVPVLQVVKDLDLGSERNITILARRAQREGYDVRIGEYGHRRNIWVDRFGMAKVEERAERYWNNLYGRVTTAIN